MPRFCIVGVMACRRPRSEQQQKRRLFGGVNAVPLAGGEGDESAGGALGRLARGVDRDAATDDVDDGALADVVVAHCLAGLEFDDDGPAFGGAEENARDLSVVLRDARRAGAGVAWPLFLGRGWQRGEVPALHDGKANVLRLSGRAAAVQVLDRLVALAADAAVVAGSAGSPARRR